MCVLEFAVEIHCASANIKTLTFWPVPQTKLVVLEKYEGKEITSFWDELWF